MARKPAAAAPAKPAAAAPAKPAAAATVDRTRAQPGDEVLYFRRYGLDGFRATVVKGEDENGVIGELTFDNGVREATKRDVPFRAPGTNDESWAWPGETQ